MAAGGYDAIVAYRWHPWFGQKIHVSEVIERCAKAVARCRPDEASRGVVRELPVWMLDAGACEAMRPVPSPLASASTLSALTRFSAKCRSA